MTIAVHSVLQTFDGRLDRERQEAAVEILRRVTLSGGELTEDSLVEAADDLFRLLDSEEAADAAALPGRGLDRRSRHGGKCQALPGLECPGRRDRELVVLEMPGGPTPEEATRRWRFLVKNGKSHPFWLRRQVRGDPSRAMLSLTIMRPRRVV
jgi:hypothetical protein